MKDYGIPKPEPSNRRTKPRFRDPAAHCNIGRVLDFSAGGLRVRLSAGWRIAPGDTLSLKLNDMEVRTRVTWIKRRFGKRTVGLMFQSITPELRKMLTSIAVTTLKVPTLTGVRGYAS